MLYRGMFLTFVMTLFMQAHAHTAQPSCPTVIMKIPGVQKISHEGLPERLNRLSYRFRFCDSVDVIELVQSDVSTGEEEVSTAFRGRVERIFQPTNVEDYAFRSLPSRVKLVKSKDYDLNGKFMNKEIGELHLHDGRDLHVISAHRETIENDFRALARKGDLLKQTETFAPFRTYDIVLPAPPSEGVLVTKYYARRMFGAHYQMITVKSADGYESTDLIELESGARVGIVQAYTADREGRFKIDSPVANGDYFYFHELDLSVHAPTFKYEGAIPPLSKEDWIESQGQANTNLKTRFSGPAQDKDAKKTRDILESRIDENFILAEWLNMLSSPELRPLWGDRKVALARGAASAKDLLLREYPELKKMDRVAESVNEFSLAVATLFVGGTLIEPQLRQLIETHLELLPEAGEVSERDCAEMLQGFAGKRAIQRGLPLELDQAIRKASFNLDVLRKALKRKVPPANENFDVMSILSR